MQPVRWLSAVQRPIDFCPRWALDLGSLSAHTLDLTRVLLASDAWQLHQWADMHTPPRLRIPLHRQSIITSSCTGQPALRGLGGISYVGMLTTRNRLPINQLLLVWRYGASRSLHSRTAMGWCLFGLFASCRPPTRPSTCYTRTNQGPMAA